MKRLFIIALYVFLAGCSSDKNVYTPVPNVVDTTQEQKAVSDAVNSAIKESNRTGKISDKKIENLIFAASLCGSKLESVANSLNLCYSNYARDRAELAVCSSQISELKKAHRWDWFGNLGDTIKGFLYGSLFTVIAMIALAFIGRARKLLSF